MPRHTCRYDRRHPFSKVSGLVLHESRNTDHGNTTHCPLPRNACLRRIHRRPLRPPRPRKPWSSLRTVIRNLALRPRARSSPPARCILRHLAHFHATPSRFRNRAMAITRAIPMAQYRRAIRPCAPSQKCQRRSDRHRTQTRPLRHLYHRPPEGVPVHTRSLYRLRKKTDSSQPLPIPLQK